MGKSIDEWEYDRENDRSYRGSVRGIYREARNKNDERALNSDIKYTSGHNRRIGAVSEKQFQRLPRTSETSDLIYAIKSAMSMLLIVVGFFLFSPMVTGNAIGVSDNIKNVFGLSLVVSGIIVFLLAEKKYK